MLRPLVHVWRLYDNTGSDPHLVAEETDGVLTVVNAPLLAFVEQSADVRFMPATPPSTLQDAPAFTPAEETRRSLRAMRKAFADVVLENKAWGLPVIQWREGKGVVEVPAEQLEPFARRILEVDGDPLPADEERALLSHLKI